MGKERTRKITVATKELVEAKDKYNKLVDKSVKELNPEEPNETLKLARELSEAETELKKKQEKYLEAWRS